MPEDPIVEGLYFPEDKLRAVFLLAGVEIKELVGVPCEYCSCCPQNNWWLVTTSMGKLKIGWRKRVINLDWSQFEPRPDPEIFSKHETTKGHYYIHAWSYGDLVEYVKALQWRSEYMAAKARREQEEKQ